jgi:hypothetical protein
MINFARIDGLYTEEQRRVARIISDIFPTVRLIRMEPGHPAFDPQKPYALIDEPNLAPPYHIKNLAESEIDARLIASLAENNTHDPNSKVNRLQLLEMANSLLRAKEEQEYLEERKDIMKSAMATKKHAWTHDGKTIRK